MSADFSEVARLAADLAGAGPRTAAKASQVVRRAAIDVEGRAKQAAPVDTGHLRNSITTEVGDGGLTASVGPTADYGIYVELGTSRMRPQPYMAPAAQAVEPEFVKAIEDLGGQFLD